jgi:hypothetical protein
MNSLLAIIGPVEMKELQVKLRRDIFERRKADGTARPDDSISQRLDEAEVSLKTACAAYLKVPGIWRSITFALPE